jgi:gas vesicle protein
MQLLIGAFIAILLNPSNPDSLGKIDPIKPIIKELNGFRNDIAKNLIMFDIEIKKLEQELLCLRAAKNEDKAREIEQLINSIKDLQKSMKKFLVISPEEKDVMKKTEQLEEKLSELKKRP